MPCTATRTVGTCPTRQVRAHLETQLNLIARGEAKRAAVVAHCLGEWRSKYDYFVSKIGRMQASALAPYGNAPGPTWHVPEGRPHARERSHMHEADGSAA